MKIIWRVLLLQLFIIEYAYAQDRTDSLKQILETKTMDTVYFKALYNLAIDYERKDPEIAKMYFKKHIHEMEGRPIDKWLAFTFIRFAGVYSSQGLRDSAEIFFDKAENYLSLNEDKKVFYTYYTGLGIHQKRYEQYFEALASYQEVAKVDIDILGKMNLAGNYLNMSNVYKSLGMVDEQIESIFKSLAIFEEIQQLMGLSYCYNALATLYYDQKDYEKAEEYLLKSYDLRIQQQDRRGEAVVLGNLGNVMQDTERYVEAISNFRIAFEIYEEFGMKDFCSDMQLNIAKVYLKTENPDSALYHLESALSLLYSHDESANSAPILLEIGKAHRMKNNPVLAEKYLNNALSLDMKKLDAHSRKSIYYQLSQLYTQSQNFKSALEYTHRYQQLKDSMESADLKLKVQGLEAKYAFDKKETEINLLKAEKELAQLEIEKQYGRQFAILVMLLLVVIIAFLLVNRYRLLNRSKRLLEIEKMRSEIARDLHDDLGSTLSSINITSNMAASSPNGNLVTSLTKISEQSSRMMEDMSDIVWSINPNHDTLDQVVIKMKTFASEILEPKNIAFVMQVDSKIKDLKLDVEKRKNLFLIFKESINNVAKYSEGSSVKIQIVAENGSLKFTIEDDGKGFDPGNIKAGNGLHNMESRAARINGKLIRASAPGKGTSVTLEIPIT